MNNRLAGVIVAGAVIVGIIPYARSGDAPAVPPGVTAHNWIPMGERAGFVITSAANDYKNGLRSEQNVLKGYFMVRRDGVWLRMEPGPGPGIYPTEFKTSK